MAVTAQTTKLCQTSKEDSFSSFASCFCPSYPSLRRTSHAKKRPFFSSSSVPLSILSWASLTYLRQVGLGLKMGEPQPLGQLKVTVVRGKRLVIRDFKSSDPYVVLKLGNQTAKTKVISSCLNPVWNEELTLSVYEPVGVLYIEVFDKDRFKADDKMGSARVNLQPIVSAARLRQILKLSSGETTLRKVAPDGENCLIRESSITSVSGEVVQELWLRLCDVESGEVELKLKFIDSAAGGMR